MKNNIMEVTFVSVWDEGVGVETSAKYNSETGVVFDIEVTGEGIEELETLELEYIRLSDGTELSVSNESGEYRAIDFSEMLKEAMSDVEPFCAEKDYPLFDEALIDFANDKDVVLSESDLFIISTSMDIDEDGYPYIDNTIQIPKYKSEIVISAYHHNKWDFYIKGFRVID